MFVLLCYHFHDSPTFQAVADSMKSSCKCHGSSGACTAQTCWESTPDFKKVAAKLKSKYHSAVYVYKKNIEKTLVAGDLDSV